MQGDSTRRLQRPEAEGSGSIHNNPSPSPNYSYLLLIHAGMISSRYGPGYRDTGYGTGVQGTDPAHKGTGIPESRV
ncbi:hypothetical protein RHMOL_Rhmol02G0051700 [Rhododendron molle]|uniref:Uncharacterized protein n=1 Tax=Rhododendron molle TaxID=49168 RepID=A0ACC0PM77_RHOML|nr:hypothetical protein RHMOL_Rhmol02G0051700 [Rhododendron molle]